MPMLQVLTNDSRLPYHFNMNLFDSNRDKILIARRSKLNAPRLLVMTSIDVFLVIKCFVEDNDNSTQSCTFKESRCSNANAVHLRSETQIIGWFLNRPARIQSCSSSWTISCQLTPPSLIDDDKKLSTSARRSLSEGKKRFLKTFTLQMELAFSCLWNKQCCCTLEMFCERLGSCRSQEPCRLKKHGTF